ncbi:NAD(P)H-dependent oxidoreductase [Gilvimarinus japonicus]|uniref:NAD(P)H-dependent oxidoreductase n=1 Tax=Gilvimarinus japonicus TaxID=1796469 RepID=A0ABV7HPB1_9GAMM
MNIIDAMNWRYAVREFSDEKITALELRELLEAVRLSASSYGLQPYRIVVVESQAVRERLLPFSYGQSKIAKSSHLIVFAALNQPDDAAVDRYIDKYMKVSGKSYGELANLSNHMKSALVEKTLAQRQEWAHQQAYIALGNLLTCAALMKIDSCPMTGVDSAGYDAVLGLEELGLTTSVICPIGRRNHGDVQAHSPKVRFDYDEIVMEV